MISKKWQEVAAGRKHKSPIWDYFEYDPLIDKSKSIVMRTDGNICGIRHVHT